MNDSKVISMRATNPGDRHPEPSHLQPVHPQTSEKPVGDRVILQRFRNGYRQTGRCDSLPALAEVARLAYKRELVSPKQAQMLFEELEEIESKLPPLFTDLWVGVTGWVENGGTSATPSEARFGLLHPLTQMVELLDRLTAIARNHPDLSEPGVSEGVASCYIDTVKRVNDLRYSLAYLNRALRPQRLQQSFSQQPELTRATLGDTIDELEYIAITLIPRLRDNIARKVPQLLGSVIENSTPAKP